MAALFSLLPFCAIERELSTYSVKTSGFSARFVPHLFLSFILQCNTRGAAIIRLGEDSERGDAETADE
ncbi:hypothetical protein [Trinickia sp.]|uniref:hypothetical protein n=1 Tax=Trinickia sp. TaxID=2571163 RepID=UPI003F81DD80